MENATRGLDASFGHEMFSEKRQGNYIRVDGERIRRDAFVQALNLGFSLIASNDDAFSAVRLGGKKYLATRGQ